VTPMEKPARPRGPKRPKPPVTLRVNGRTLSITYRSEMAARASRPFWEDVFRTGATLRINPTETMQLFASLVDILKVQSKESGSFVRRMRKGQLAGVF
jgi:hypothetical protein